MRTVLSILSILGALGTAPSLAAQQHCATSAAEQPPPDAPAGPRTLLVIRATFADETLPHPKGIGGAGGYLTPQVAWQMVADTADFLAAQSHGAVTLDLAGSVVTPTLQLPITRAQGAVWGHVLLAGVAAAIAKGHDPADHDLSILAFSHVPQIPWAGLATVPILMNGAWSTSTMRHEIGHRLGAGHTSFHVASAHDILGTGQAWVKSDPYDVMGSSGWDNPAAHFVAARKRDLGWLPAARVATVTAGGSYRLYGHDLAVTTGLAALRLEDTANGAEYWIETRQLPVPAGVEPRPRKNEGVLVYRRALGAGPWADVHLLDFTPETHPDPALAQAIDQHRNDAPLVVGQTFTHRRLDLHVTPVARHGEWPPSIDVVVNVGPFPGNGAPQLALSAAGTVSLVVGQQLVLSATASDPDGDELALYWDLGDGDFAMQVDQVAHAFAKVGEYVVRCVASDMKGRTATRTVVARVGAPSTGRIAGTVRDLAGAPIDNVLVHAGDSACYTDADGRYTLVGLPGGQVQVAAGSHGITFHPPGQTVGVGGGATGVDFVGTYLFGGGPTNQPPTVAIAPKSGAAGGAKLSVAFDDPEGAETLVAATIDLSWPGGSVRLFPDLYFVWPLLTGRELFAFAVAPDSGALVLTLKLPLAHVFTLVGGWSVAVKAAVEDAMGNHTVQVAEYVPGG